MPHVPRTSQTRSSHRFRARSTHDYDGAYQALSGGASAADQAGVDGVPSAPVVITTDGGTPGFSLDFTAPEVPTGLVLTSDTGLDKDGRSILRLIATLVQPPDSDLFASYVEITAENDGNPDPALVAPIWTNPAVILIGNEATSGAVEGVRGLTQYWARAYSADVTGNRSEYTAVVTATTIKDNDAPGQPQNVEMAAGFRGFGIHWSAGISSDLMFVEVRYAVDDGSGTGPDTTAWQLLRVRTNTVWIDGLTIDQKYWAQIRSVDFSGNTVTSTADSTAVDYLSNPEAGWTGLASVIPLAVGAADVAFNSVLTNILASNMIDAATIQTGILNVDTGTAGRADGIRIWNGSVLVGFWDETGLYVADTAAGLPVTPGNLIGDLSASSYVHITDAGLTVYLAGSPTSAITPEGINATAINFGTLPGGHNLLQNSSFELSDFAAAASTATWDVAADWTATQLSNTNATNGANSVTQTASTY